MVWTGKKFIVFEGIDGSGKSTQARLLHEKLTINGVANFLTAEPTNRPIGKLIRDIFAHRLYGNDATIAALFVADRLEHLTYPEDGILHHLNKEVLVICDRYYLSSYAYQGIHVSLEWVIQANAMSVSMAKPDVHVFIDLPVEMALERLIQSRQHIERYETLENLKKVRDQYFLVIDQLKSEEQIVVLDGSQNQELLSKQIWDLLSN